MGKSLLLLFFRQEDLSLPAPRHTVPGNRCHSFNSLRHDNAERRMTGIAPLCLTRVGRQGERAALLDEIDHSTNVDATNNRARIIDAECGDLGGAQDNDRLACEGCGEGRLPPGPGHGKQSTCRPMQRSTDISIPPRVARGLTRKAGCLRARPHDCRTLPGQCPFSETVLPPSVRSARTPIAAAAQPPAMAISPPP